MKSLTNLVNTDPVSPQFPYGDIKDNTGTNNGTPMNRAMFSDVLQFLQKLADEAGVTPNDVVDNEYDGFQVYEAFRKLTKPYNVYTANHAQVSTSAPTTSPLGLNEIGTIVWTRTNTGEYLGTLSGAFPSAKTIVLCNNGGLDSNTTFSIRRITDDEIEIKTFAAGSPSDGISGFSFEIRVYD